MLNNKDKGRKGDDSYMKGLFKKDISNVRLALLDIFRTNIIKFRSKMTSKVLCFCMEMSLARLPVRTEATHVVHPSMQRETFLLQPSQEFLEWIQ
jgi:hypothetical protein